jgi:site-specific DNA-methyltransferase (adenine-specific)
VDNTDVDIIYNMDCLKGMRIMKEQGQEANCIITSPPYHFGHSYIGYDDKRPREDYDAFLVEVLSAMGEILKEDGSVFINTAPSPKEPDRIITILMMIKKEFVIQNIIHWIKSAYIEENNYGYKRHLNSQRHVDNEHEYIIHATKRKHKIVRDN